MIAGAHATASLIYGSATGFALGDPARASFAEGLGLKMALEIAPRVGRVVRARQTRVGLAGVVLGSLALVADRTGEDDAVAVGAGAG